jgi:hypothetical protein
VVGGVLYYALVKLFPEQGVMLAASPPRDEVTVPPSVALK